MDVFNILNEFDASVLVDLNSLHSPFFDDFMWMYTGKLIWAFLYASILFLILKNNGIKRSIILILSFILLIVIADQLVGSVLRPFFERLRPSNLRSPLGNYLHIVNHYRGGRYGFPSCHASNTFALAFFVTFLFKKPFLSITFFIWAILNSYTRIYLGVHYPGDILFGLFVGFGAAGFVYLLLKKVVLITGSTELTEYTKNTMLPTIVFGTTVLFIVLYSFVAFLR